MAEHHITDAEVALLNHLHATFAEERAAGGRVPEEFDELAQLASDLAAGWRVIQADDKLGIIGRDRALVEHIARQLYHRAMEDHHYGPLREERRGNSFDLQVVVGDTLTGHVVRVTVELERVEDRPLHG